MRAFKSVCAVVALALAGSPALAKDPVKIGLITTLSGPAGYLGADIRDGFMLAVEAKGGPFEGNKPEVLIEDDGIKPGQAKSIADRFLKGSNVKIFTGIVFGNVAAAVVPDVLDAGAIYVSPNSAATNFAGKGCNPNYFVVSFQNDGQGESVGALAKSLGYKKAYLLAPNYPSGKDMLQAFKREFGGEVVAEKYTNLGQTDFAVEIAEIRAANPDFVHGFQPGGMGIAFLRQYHQAGLKIPLVMHAASMDQAMVKVLKDAAVGVQVASQWNDDFDNPASKAFVAAWKAKYGDRPVTSYAAQGYDAGLLIGSGLKATNFSTDNMDAVSAAMRKADFASVRGNFKFDKNQHPIQDWYALKADKTPSGDFVLKTGAKVLSNHGDIYAKDCKM
ncbi:ABC transporter substrate-binding protein [Pseudorhodoplanes sp.]|uniref:ABC transporter substrate-binding protein n=1 Tax=Pseudorhodoplanes sp. TaxID=1934341 RepID=UPI002CDE2B62|nr:ABC transporter substrate-binding protein [Pseudorhodoplanes sp.]HWV41756.1 ABC transporter substrate-binding protein [Pseudorhodoplanes sp.]